jgi:GntR family transcriptional regulator/MocR family aminotransferase
MRDLLFHLQRDSRTPLQTQLRELLVSAILQGQIPVGSPLPSSRKLAETLDVARNTVALAYQELVADGFLVAHERRGYFINGEILGGRAPAVAVARAQACNARLARRLKLPEQPAQYRQAPRLAELPVSLHLRPDRSDLFPISDWRECSRQA